MSNCRKKNLYSAQFKKKVALEAIAANKTIAQISSEYSVMPARIQQWKKLLIDNAQQVFEQSKKNRVSGDILQKNQQIEKLQQKVGELYVENDFFKKKLLD